MLGRPAATLLFLAALLAYFAYFAKDFTLDASADSILLEDDQDLRIYREALARYGTQELLVVTFTPRAEIMSDESLDTLKQLRGRLRQVPAVDSVLTLLDVPLLTTTDITLAQLSSNIPTLETPGIDRARAKQELLTSPVFSNLLISADGGTTALLLNLKSEPRVATLAAARSELFSKRSASGLTDPERQRLEAISAEYFALRATIDAQRHRDIEAIRAIMKDFAPRATVHLGGVPMITDDMITYVRNDLMTFGFGVLVFMIVTLTVIFRRKRWVFLPLLSCFYAGLLMIGLLGLLGWKVTVISSNFISLMLIMTLSMNIHLIVRYRQLAQNFRALPQIDLVFLTTGRMVWPCVYTALTTIIGFASLVFSGIKPVIDFGWMMSMGLAVTFLTSFLLFPSILTVLGKMSGDTPSDSRIPFTHALADITARHGGVVLAVSGVVAVLTVVGIMRLQVENSFVNYFRQSTEIHQGMKLIDDKLGGTTPLDVLLHLAEELEPESAEEECDDPGLSREDREECEELQELYAEQEETAASDYWFTPFKIQRIKAVHDYLDSLPEVGKVLSVASMIRVGERINGGKEFTSFEMAILYKKIPPRIRARLIDPYVSIDDNEARITLRILDSRKDLRRKELLDRIHSDLHSKLGLGDQDVTVTGILVLYNNMLQSLFKSQILTAGVVICGIALMFLILFRSVALSVIGIIPNVLASGMVLGIMGLAGIPLDMMTITIAAITLGIAVDNSIHYIYRFREEFGASKDYQGTLYTCHANIGKAVLYTSITIIFGFSILVFSNFIPTIYFGVLTAIAMSVALLAALTLLPKLILMWRPFLR